jgi:hypothetical protein
MKKLLVHKTLMSRGINHWMLFGCSYKKTKYENKDAELYEVSNLRFLLIRLFEFFCGWQAKFIKDFWVFSKKP